LHDDYRDYYKREGWSAYARLAPRRTGLSATLEYADERHHAQPARDPWTLFSNDDDWRLQPLIAEGRFRSLTAAIDFDRRNDDDFPTSGFLLRGSLTQGLDGTLTLPLLIPAAFDADFTRGIVDARVYQPVGRKATLSLRGVAGGALSEHDLPPQFQHALGGPGSLPGYSLFNADCGARRAVTTSNNDTYYASYGCDRFAMMSAEYRGGFDFHIGGWDHWDDDDQDARYESRWDFDATPKWAVFFDAGRGWGMNQSKARGATNTEMLYDVGAGIILDDVGIYGAVPLSGSDRTMKFFIRLGPRF
jgi:outer membrane protein assembly factor BamA